MGFKIKEYREQQGITQKELAKKAGVSRTIINQLETGAKKKYQCCHFDKNCGCTAYDGGRYIFLAK